MKKFIFGFAALAFSLFLFSFFYVRRVSLEGLPSDLQKKRVFLVHFWSVDCSVCLSELGLLRRFWLSLDHRDVGFLSVLVWSDRARALNFLRNNRALFPYPIVFDEDGHWSHRFGGIHVVPTSFLVDKTGRIEKTYLGSLDIHLVEKQLNKVLSG